MRGDQLRSEMCLSARLISAFSSRLTIPHFISRYVNIWTPQLVTGVLVVFFLEIFNLKMYKTDF
jgi:hypothetical protein